MYALDSLNASEEKLKNAIRPEGVEIARYLMKSVSRSWSRAINDLVVRYLAKRSCISRFWYTRCAGQSSGLEITCKVLESATR
jgi:hypothetical protein